MLTTQVIASRSGLELVSLSTWILHQFVGTVTNRLQWKPIRLDLNLLQWNNVRNIEEAYDIGWEWWVSQFSGQHTFMETIKCLIQYHHPWVYYKEEITKFMLSLCKGRGCTERVKNRLCQNNGESSRCFDKATIRTQESNTGEKDVAPCIW